MPHTIDMLYQIHDLLIQIKGRNSDPNFISIINLQIAITNILIDSYSSDIDFTGQKISSIKLEINKAITELLIQLELLGTISANIEDQIEKTQYYN